MLMAYGGAIEEVGLRMWRLAEFFIVFSGRELARNRYEVK